MNTPPPEGSASSPRPVADPAQVRAWLELKRELSELHAKLEYLRLMVSLGVRQDS